MKKYSQEEYDALPVIDEYKECPTGDYTAIKYFDQLKTNPVKKRWVGWALGWTGSIVVYLYAREEALVWRGYEAVGGEILLLFLPIVAKVIAQTASEWRELFSSDKKSSQAAGTAKQGRRITIEPNIPQKVVKVKGKANKWIN